MGENGGIGSAVGSIAAVAEGDMHARRDPAGKWDYVRRPEYRLVRP